MYVVALFTYCMEMIIGISIVELESVFLMWKWN